MVLLKLMYLKIYEHQKRAHFLWDDTGAESKRGQAICVKDVGSYLDPREEQVHCVHVVVLGLPERQKSKIGVDIRILQQLPKQLAHFDSPKHIKYDGNDGKL